MQEIYNRIKEIVDSAEEDVSKSASGNKAAGVRVRKQMLEVRKLAQQLRKQIFELRQVD